MTSSRHDQDALAPDRFAAMVRAFVPVPVVEKPKPNFRKTKIRRAPPSEWCLVFDTETTTDAAQSLRFGAYQLRKTDKLVEQGLFYEPEALSPTDVGLLRRSAASRRALLLTRAEFVEQVFYEKAYDLRASIVGFNLPFDISRLAMRHNSARGKKMKGGFTFQLSANPRRARVQIRHLSRRAAFIQFAGPPRQQTPRGARKRNMFTPIRRGAFIDLKTIAAALLSKSFSLKSLAEHLKTPSQKLDAGTHGEALTDTYVQYALQDVQVTWEAYERLSKKFEEHGLPSADLGKIMSEASLGKAYLRAMGIKSFREVQPDFPADVSGLIMSTYFGGRSEVRWRRTIKQVLYCDFLSMYPTVCTLMGLWRFVIAQGVTWSDMTQATQDLIDRITFDDLQQPETWQQLHTIVQIKPDHDVLSVRAKYDGKSPTIGLNKTSGEEELWYTLADIILSKLLTGRAPRISRATTFQVKAPQDDLKPLRIGGPSGPMINPLVDDLYKRLIDLRTEVKDQFGCAPADQRSQLEAEQQALKILANSTSYGIFVEFNVSDLDRFEQRTCYGPAGIGFPVQTNKSEEPGPFLHPLIATLITGAARLMLAISEKLASDVGLDWAFCDTDSMAFAKPDEMSPDEFFVRARNVVDWFAPLNPYEKPGSLQKIEDADYAIGDRQKLQALYALCISAKRYALFNLDDGGCPVLRKASAHGLGHLLAPYESDEAPKLIPAPSVPLEAIGVERWQHDLWYQIITATLDGHSEEVDLSYHDALRLPAMSRYSAATPAILRWLAPFNDGKPYREQVKPFGFLSALQADLLAVTLAEASEITRSRRKPSTPRPIAPFSNNPECAAQNAFDRGTGVPVDRSVLMTYASTLARYHLSPEAKFLNGEFCNAGRTERRHVHVTAIIHIGKEANKWEEQFYLGADEEEQIEYGASSSESLDDRLRRFVQGLGERESARQLGIARMTLRKALQYGSTRLNLSRIYRLN